MTATFHGRDIFMPVAAHLAAGTELAAAGEDIDAAGLVTLPAPRRQVHDGTAAGEVLTVDRFGNLQLTITAADAAQIGLAPGAAVLVERCGRRQLTAALRRDLRRGRRRRARRLRRQCRAGLDRGERGKRGAAARPGAGGAGFDYGGSITIRHDAYRARRARGTMA